MNRITTHQTPPAVTAGRQRGGLGLWMLVLLVLVGAAIGAVLAGVWVFGNVKASLLVTNAPATAVVPQEFNVSATILNKLDIALNGQVHTQVPVDKVLTVPVSEPLELLVTFDAYVPVNLNVEVNKSITIDQKMDIDTVLQADLLGDTFPLPIRGQFPVTADVPLRIVIPVSQMLHLKFTAPIKARLKEPLKVPLNTVIDATVPLKTRMSVPINNALKAVVQLPDKELPIEIIYADLEIPLDNLSFGLDDAAAKSDSDDQPSESQP